MKTELLYLFIILFLSITCSRTERLDKKIVGKWKMEKVYEYNSDVTKNHNPENNRWIEFNSSGTFVSGGEPFGKNTGRWKTDNSKSILFIDSDVENDNSEWNVTFRGNEMSWTGIGNPRKENTTLIHKRILK